MNTHEGKQTRNEGLIDPAVYEGPGVKRKVIDQINAAPTAAERMAYARLLSDMLAKNPDVEVNDIEDIRIPGVVPPLPGTDRAKTSAVTAVDVSRLRQREGERSGVRATPDKKYVKDMTLKDGDLEEIDEEEARQIEAALKLTIQGYDTKKSLTKE